MVATPAGGRYSYQEETVNTSYTQQQQAASIARALDRAQAQAALGNLPTLTETSFDGTAIRETWNVTSRHGRGVYAVSLTQTAEATRTTCTCPATGPCWHRAAARLASAGTIASHNQAGYRIRPRGK